MKRLLDKDQYSSIIEDLTVEKANIIERRIDWRFLLPNPNPEKSICFSSGLIAEALKAKLQTNINSDSHYTPDYYDLAVAVNPDIKTLNAAHSALKPGGICYLEWDVNILFRASKIRKIFKAIGFDEPSIYLPKPAPDTSLTGIWIPFESLGAIEYLIKQSYKQTNQNFLLRMAKLLRNTLWSISPDLILSNPFLLSSTLNKFTISIISHKPQPDYSKELNAQKGNVTVPRYILDNLTSALKGRTFRSRMDNISVIMLTKGRAIHNKIVLIVFNERERVPLVVIKIPRSDTSINSLLNEVQILNKLEDKFAEMEGIPKIIFFKNDPDLFVAGQTFLNGIPLSSILKKENYSDLAYRVTSWLIEFAKRSKTELNHNWREAQIEPIISAFSSNYSSVINPKQLSVTQDIINNLTVPFLVCEHRDVGPWNVMINDKGELGFADWESAELYGLPGRDLIYFMIYLGLSLYGNWKPENMRTCYREMLDHSTFTGSIFHECTNCYFSELGLPESSIKPLRLLTFLIHSLERFNRRFGSSIESVDSNMLRESLYFICWEEEVSDIQ